MALNGGCPGAKLFKEIKPDYIDCPHCRREVEIWSDELIITCPYCKGEVSQSRGASCIDWCQFARECVGAEKFERLQQEA
jgi:Zn finger protein HypA/HybF involved in hydrogenase expression